jgi:NADH-quinone oxidoreductase subunit C
MTESHAGGLPERLRQALDGTAPGTGLEFRVPPERLRGWVDSMRERGLYLVFITVVDVDPEPEVVYQFACFERACRVTLLVSPGTGRSVPSIADMYQGADWHEREAYEFFGIGFSGHTHLKPLILSRAEKGLRPLLKNPQVRRRRDELFSSACPEQSQHEEG